MKQDIIKIKLTCHPTQHDLYVVTSLKNTTSVVVGKRTFKVASVLDEKEAKQLVDVDNYDVTITT